MATNSAEKLNWVPTCYNKPTKAESVYIRQGLAIGLFSVALTAQTPGQAEATRLTRELRTAIERDDLTSAMDLAAKVDDSVQTQHRAWLIRDVRDRVEEVLHWLPADTEGLWVNQEPFVIRTEESLELLYGRPTQVYALDRLSALNEGKIYRALANRTIRLVMAGTRDIRGQPLGIPGPIPAQDIAYFYFFSEPVDLGAADESVQDRPVWRGVAKIDAGAPFEAGVDRPQREDENWIALAKPDLLVLTNKKALLEEILDRMARGSKVRALPAALPEWNQVDRRAPFWGLRHYADQSKPKPNERGYKSAELPQPDGAAIGAAVQFDTAQQRLEIRYLSDAQLAQPEPMDSLRREFRVDQPQAGVWRLVSNVRERGPWPVYFALTMLGFGVYR